MRALLFGLALWLIVAPHAHADADTRCATTTPLLTLANALPRMRAELAGSGRIVIVAIGSSSTQGHGASSVDRTYPAQLAAALRARYPVRTVEVLNRGIGGETARQMVARFDRDVIAHAPQLVLWQTGANDALRRVPIEEFVAALEHGIEVLRDYGADVVLLPPQYAPKLIAVPNSEAYLARLHETAARHHVPVFRRYAIMHELALKQPDALGAMLTADGLHLNDLGYHCLATQLVDVIAPAPSRPLIATGARATKGH
jgi:acyl-CoA thioesterase-1